MLSWLTSFLPWLPLGAVRPSLPAQLGAFLLYALSIGGLLLAALATTLPRRALLSRG